MGPLEALDLLLDFFSRLLRDHLLLDFLAVVLDLLGQLFPFAQLRLNRLELLAEEVLALAFVHLPLRGRGDLLLHGEEVDLASEQLIDFLQPLHRIDGLQDLLRLFELEVEVGCRQVRQPRRIVQIRGDDHHFRRNVLPQADGAVEVLFDGAHECFDLQRAVLRHRLFDAGDLGFEERRGLDEVVDARAREALHQDANASVGELEHAHDDGHRAHAVEIVLAWIFVLKILLRGEHDDPVFGQGLVDGVDRLFARHGQRNDDEGEDHQVLQRQHRKDVRDLDRLFFRGFVRVRHVILRLRGSCRPLLQRLFPYTLPRVVYHVSSARVSSLSSRQFSPSRRKRMIPATTTGAVPTT